MILMYEQKSQYYKNTSYLSDFLNNTYVSCNLETFFLDAGSTPGLCGIIIRVVFYI